MTRAALAFLLFCHLIPSFAAAVEPNADPVDPITMMPLSEVRAGMEGVVRTVFEGTDIEEFQAEIIDVMPNFLGPGQDLILARLKGKRVEFTGVAAGMSGSPVYIDGRLVGALSYRIGSFMKEPIAGITPIGSMLNIERAGTANSHGEGMTSGGSGLEPIATPLMAAGVPAAVMDTFRGELKELGLGPLMAGASGDTGSEEPQTGLLPGQPVAMQLVRGDISLAATGTVTYVDEDRVFAFGHPSITLGATEMPMARARIYLTLPSMEASTKIGRVMETIGTFHQSRLPGITGLVGPRPRMIPMSVTVLGLDGGPKALSFELVDNRDFTPILVGFTTLSGLVRSPEFSGESTMELKGRVKFRGHPDLILEDLHTGYTANQSAALSIARQVQGLFRTVYRNRFEQPVVESVDLSISAVEKGSLGVVESVHVTRTEALPGEEVEFRIVVRMIQGQPETHTFTYRVPEGTPPGRLTVYLGAADQLDRLDRNVLTRQAVQAGSLDQIIQVVNDFKRNDALYMRISRRSPGAVVMNRVLPSLPPSVATTLRENRTSGEVTPLATTTILEESIPLEHVVVGGALLSLEIR